MEQELFCRARLGAERGDKVIALIEETTGQLCPCKQGQVCPLSPAAIETPPLVVEVA